MAKVIYEPHPVSPERKAELRAQGLRIIDARFKPETAEDAPAAESAELTAEAIDGMDKDAVRKLLLEREVEHDGRASVEDLRDVAKNTIL